MDTTTAPVTERRPVTTGCCPPFDPATWPSPVTWHDKMFVREHVHSIFHVPIDMGRTIKKSMRLIEQAHVVATPRLMLSEERSPWGADLYIEVTGPVPGAEVVSLSGTFMTKVYEGPFRDALNWAHDMRGHVRAHGQILQKLYFGYTTCPSCAKAYGKNYVVLFAEVTPAASVQG